MMFMTKNIFASVLRFFAISILFFQVFIFATPFVQAEEAAVPPPPPPGCSCFCQTPEGAIPTDETFKTKIAPKDCLALCKKKGKDIKSTCAFTIDQFPARTLQCFTEQQCTIPFAYTGTDKKQLAKVGIPIGIFKPQDQVPECPKTMHYCFPNPKLSDPLVLNVGIGSMKQTLDLGEYINTVYSWMIGAGITFAIVFIMIAGLQYVLGASGTEVGKAKERIMNATIGLILLLCVHLILKTVNPYLVNLQVPQLPMLKTIDLLKQNLSCEKMKLGYNLTDTEGKIIEGSDLEAKKCGDSALVKEKKDGTTVVAGTTCDFDFCSDKEAGCLGTGAKATCRKCAEVTFKNKEQPPSSQICSALQSKMPDKTKQNKINYCFYSHDPSVVLTATKEIFGGSALVAAAAFSGPFALTVGAGLTAVIVDNIVVGTCAEIKLDCDQIKECDDYENKVEAKSSIVGDHLEGFFNNPLWGEINLKTMCEANPCNVKFKNTDGKVLESVSQKNVCKLKLGNDYSIWDAAKNDCVQKGTVETGTAVAVEKGKGSCDPAKCLAPKQCAEDVTGNKACVECGDVVNGNDLASGASLEATDLVCLGLSSPEVGVKKTSG
ncbi:MAG: pilin, partial [Patescibacteria group bacterium]